MNINTNRQPEEQKLIGTCEICDRGMVEGSSTDRHHLIPVVKKGKNGPLVTIHKICHQKIHSIWTEGELARTYNTTAIIKAAPEMQEFIAFLRNKPLDYYDSSKMNNRKRR